MKKPLCCMQGGLSGMGAGAIRQREWELWQLPDFLAEGCALFLIDEYACLADFFVDEAHKLFSDSVGGPRAVGMIGSPYPSGPPLDVSEHNKKTV